MLISQLKLTLVLEINIILIKECNSYKYLGLVVDKNLKFDLHFASIKRKVQKRIGAMYRGSSLLPIKYRAMFSNALILPNFEHLDTIRGLPLVRA